MRRALAALACLAALGATGCGGSSGPPWTGALPSDPGDLASHLIAADLAWRQGAAAWLHGSGPAGEPPAALTQPAGYVERAAEHLAQRPGLAAATAAAMPARLGTEMRDLVSARRDELRLAGGSSGASVQTGLPDPLPWLLHSYHEAERRFGVDWHVLAAINLVESRFGRASGTSTAGAQGPMQFIRSTWHRYGLGGNVYDPHDAVIGAANFLSRAGAPSSYRDALYAYNPSLLYVDAVLRYARVIGHDGAALYLLYSW